MSEQTSEPNERPDAGESAEPGEYGHLSVEDDPRGTVDPADLAGTAGPQDEPAGYQPAVTEADEAGA